MKKKMLYMGLILLFIIFLIVGIPLLINESYKLGCGYITVWSGEDVLGYYGSVLGSIIAVATLTITIIFTRKQIQRESYLTNENNKWSKIESVFADILDGINPIRPLKETMDNGFTDPAKATNILQKYQMNCQMAVDQLNAHLNMVDYPKVKKLIDEITKASDVFFKTTQAQIDNYIKLRDLQHRSVAERMLNLEKTRPGSFSEQELSDSKTMIEKTNNIIYTDIENDLRTLTAEIVREYETTYKELLKCKGATFETINLEVQQTADNMLKFRVR